MPLALDFVRYSFADLERIACKLTRKALVFFCGEGYGGVNDLVSDLHDLDDLAKMIKN